MNAKRVTLLIAMALLLGVGLGLLGYYGFYLQEYREIPYDFDVRVGGIGINAGTDAIHFGGVNPGGSGYRFMNITAAHDGRLVIAFKGDGASYLYADPNNVRVSRGQPLRVQLSIAVPDDARLGNYSGVAKFYFYKR